MSRSMIAAAALLLTQLLAASAAASAAEGDLRQRATPEEPEETREHYVLRHATSKTVHFEVTVVDRASERVDETVLLVSDLEHGPFILRMRHVYEDQTVLYEISDVKRKDYIRTSFKMPFTARTRSEMLSEARSSPTVGMLPALLTITTPGGEWRSIDAEDAEWERLRELRYSIRPTVSFYLLEGAERMRGALFATTRGKLFFDLVGRYLVYQTTDDTAPQLEEAQGEPSCEFDRSFGYPCSEEQESRVRAAAKAGKRLPRY